MAKRSTLILGIGLIVFVIGAGATFLVLRDDDGGTAAAASSTQSSVLYAAKDIPSGITGAQAVDQGYVKTRTIDNSSKPSGALADTSELAGKSAQGKVSQGTVLTSTQFAAPQTTRGDVKIPDGKMALAITLKPAQGVAGYVGVGDRIDVFGVLKEGPGSPAAKLIMQNTEVLSSSLTGATVAAANATDPTYLLAVTAEEAERLVFYTSFNDLYFSLVSKDAGNVGPTPGSSPADALTQLS